MNKLLPYALPLIVSLAACGQAGPLYLPEKHKPPVPQAPPPAVAHPPAGAAAEQPPEAPPSAVAKPRNSSENTPVKP
ncbi:hypothetical protein D0B54_23270 [Solimonas sp. K1W22B-7]|uniref:LPS translocon maturation chaperone LptM n=1 Tax=Solimonas sp. K1W22B-7 TaxID=2303331 RepID=UPI000E336D8B|nr:lipoprotein [Solimonas sp. K1W22B-7]AXQ31423.1 hypothetical protein D0B54_23270 [Solimonas sp. K1W22B-7]